MNVYDSLRMKNLMLVNNYKVCDNANDADVIILNTCHIRQKAVQKFYSELGRVVSAIKKNSASAIVVVAGCVGQAEGEEIFSRVPSVDIVVGSQSYIHLPSLIKEVQTTGKKAINLDFVDWKKFDDVKEQNLYQGASSFVSIQEGCDKFCHFCVVPFTRGAEFSRPFQQIYNEVLSMVEKGTKEVVLLGQNVSAYHGKNTSNKESTLAELISHIAQIKGLERIRYTTSHPIDINDDLISLHALEKKLMPFLHLPFQSGSDKILKNMNRKYSKQEYIDLIDRFRSKKSDMAFSTDIIVGYPGEDFSDFQDTLDIVEYVGFSQCYFFKYSPRPGTLAALKPQVAEPDKDYRMNLLKDLVFKKQLEFSKKFIGKTVKVLVDSVGKEKNQVKGRDQYFQPIYLEGTKSLISNIIDAKVVSVEQNAVSAVLQN